MRLTTILAIASFAIALNCSEAAAFGRGAPPRGGGGGGGGFHPAPAAPPRAAGGGGGGGRSGIGAGPYGGVHEVAPSAPRVEAGPRAGGFPHESYAPREEGPRGVVGERAAGGIASERGAAARDERFRGGVTLGGAGGFEAGRVGHNTSYMRSATLAGIGRNIRGGQYPYFTRDWYGNHAGVWFPGLWFGGVGPWFAPPWDNVGPFLGIAGGPIDYDYGSTAVIQDGSMYLNGEQVASADDYANQALSFADAGRAAGINNSDEWEPLGVFGLIQGNEQVAQRIFQLAVNKAGIVHGNYYDAVADSNQPVFGSVDKTSQRVAWSIGDRKDIVYEAGLNNLTQNETTVLIHYGKTRTQQMVLVRLPEPPQGK